MLPYFEFTCMDCRRAVYRFANDLLARPDALFFLRYNTWEVFEDETTTAVSVRCPACRRTREPPFQPPPPRPKRQRPKHWKLNPSATSRRP